MDTRERIAISLYFEIPYPGELPKEQLWAEFICDEDKIEYRQQADRVLALKWVREDGVTERVAVVEDELSTEGLIDTDGSWANIFNWMRRHGYRKVVKGE